MELAIAVTAVIFSLVVLTSGPLAGFIEFIPPEDAGKNYGQMVLMIWLTGIIMIAVSGGGMVAALYVAGFSLFIMCVLTLARLLYFIHHCKEPVPAPTGVYIVVTSLSILALACFNFANHWIS